MYLQLSLDYIRDIGTRTHKDFVDKMHERFSIKQHPGYCECEVLPLIYFGGFRPDPPKIFLNDLLESDAKIIITTAHESGHFLHPFGRTQYEKMVAEKPRNRMLAEIICHLGAFIYLSFTHKEKTISFYEQVRTPLNYAELMARDIFISDQSLLEKIACIDMYKARKIIIPYLQRKIDSRKNL